ncbi:hypothetical protein DL93DRAFT_1796721 [Clavulina sp. PMI_390]|nr:hypothetical protein DL93DRAFT_1796721 [Clavulina sp. PMI_390]
MSKKLLERSGHLGKLPTPVQLHNVANMSPPPPKSPTLRHTKSQKRAGRVSGEHASPGYSHAVQQTVEQELRLHVLTESDELPQSLSKYLINLFLPYRSHYYFLVDVSYFMDCVSLPSSHPRSIHPCLLNACYLGACASTGGALALFQPYFLQRTRYFLEQSLMFADRTTHFLWANLILGVFFAKEHRLVESLTVADTTARFALACGLNLPDYSVKAGHDPVSNEYLLPPPHDMAEAEDRLRLAHSIYVGCQALPLLCGNSAPFPYDDGWSRVSGGVFENKDGKISTLGELWRLELHLKVLVTNTFQRATRFARSITAGSLTEADDEYLAIESQICEQRASFPPLYDPHRLKPLEASSPFNTHTVFGYITLYGSGLILHRSRATHDADSRAKMFECLQALVDICASARDRRRLYMGLVNTVHMMNAVRVIARELQRSEAKENPALSISHCHSIVLLLDFLDDIMLLFPAWVEAPLVLKDTLVSAATSLST